MFEEKLSWRAKLGLWLLGNSPMIVNVHFRLKRGKLTIRPLKDGEASIHTDKPVDVNDIWFISHKLRNTVAVRYDGKQNDTVFATGVKAGEEA